MAPRAAGTAAHCLNFRPEALQFKHSELLLGLHQTARPEQSLLQIVKVIRSPVELLARLPPDVEGTDVFVRI